MILSKSNMRENSKRINHTYQIGDKVMVSRKSPHQQYDGPYEILQVNTNGTIRLQMGAMSDVVNICRIHLYKQ